MGKDRKEHIIAQAIRKADNRVAREKTLRRRWMARRQVSCQQFSGVEVMCRRELEGFLFSSSLLLPDEHVLLACEKTLAKCSRGR